MERFEAENKILKDDIANNQKLIYSLAQHDNVLIAQQQGLTTELLTLPYENRYKYRNKDNNTN